MKKRFGCILLVLLLTLPLFVFPAAAGDGQSTDNTTATTATQATQPPPETQPTTPTTQPTTPETQPTTPSTQPSTEPTVSPATCTHSYGAWNTSEGSHSRTCTKCGHTDSAGHSWYSETVTVAPTCKDAGGSAKVCTVCELILITEITPPLTTHTYKNNCDAECDVCGLKREITHKYSAAWTKSAKGHWHACTVCGAAGEVKAHYPGPAATEEKEQLCLTCGYVMMQKRNHTHELEKTWSSDGFGHWHSCTGCSEQKDYAEHTFDDGCDEDCNICGYIRTAVHTYGRRMKRPIAVSVRSAVKKGRQKTMLRTQPEPAAPSADMQWRQQRQQRKRMYIPLMKVCGGSTMPDTGIPVPAERRSRQALIPGMRAGKRRTD